MKAWMLGIGVWFFTVVLAAFITVISNGYEKADIHFLISLILYAFAFTAPLIFPIVLFIYIFHRLPFSFGIAAFLLLCMLFFLIVCFFYFILPWITGKELSLGKAFRLIVIALFSLLIVFSFSLNRLRALKSEWNKNADADIFN